MKNIFLAATVAMLTFSSVTVLAQDKDKNKKECHKKCPDKCKDNCKDAKCAKDAKCDDKKSNSSKQKAS